MTSAKTNYLESTIRDGYTSEDVRMWQALCRQCETEVGDSVKYMWTILDIAQHNSCGPIGIISMGRDVCDQKNVNQKFMEALLLAVYEPDEKEPKVLDLTADDEDLSGSYEEEEGEGPFDDDRDDNPNSKDAYEIDGFVVEDENSVSDVTESEPDLEPGTPFSKTAFKKRAHYLATGEHQRPIDKIGRGMKRMLKSSSNKIETPAGAVAIKSSLKKRVLESISEEE